MKKTCKKCDLSKPLQSFSKRSSSKDGKDSYCKVCKTGMTEKWKKENPIKLKAGKKKSDKEWYLKNKQRKLEINKKWKNNNKEHIQQWYRDYKKHREMNDIEFKIANKIRTRLWHALRKNQKVGSAVKDLGCSISELKKHLETQFTKDMSWDNYGQWHIDHIKPLAQFNLENRAELLKACHYSNLQPLWASDNLIKFNH